MNHIKNWQISHLWLLLQLLIWAVNVIHKHTHRKYVLSPTTFHQYTTHTHTHTHSHTRLTALCPGLPEWTGTRKVKPICILLKQETVSGIGISWAICKCASRSRQITTPVLHHSFFYRPDALPAAQTTASIHWTVHKYLTNTQNLHGSQLHQTMEAGKSVTQRRRGVAFRNRIQLHRLYHDW